MGFSIGWYGGSHRTLKPAFSAIVSTAGFPLNRVGYFRQTSNRSIFVLYLSSPSLPLDLHLLICGLAPLHPLYQLCLPQTVDAPLQTFDALVVGGVIHNENDGSILLIVPLEMNLGMFAEIFEVFLENGSIHIAMVITRFLILPRKAVALQSTLLCRH